MIWSTCEKSYLFIEGFLLLYILRACELVEDEMKLLKLLLLSPLLFSTGGTEFDVGVIFGTVLSFLLVEMKLGSFASCLGAILLLAVTRF